MPGADGTRRRYLFDLKLIHFSSTWYRPSDVLEPGPAGCADRRARRVHDEYVRHAKELDAQHRSGDNVGLTLSGTVAPLDGGRSFRVEMSDGEVFARDVGDIGEARAAQFCAIRTQCCPFTDARSSHRR